MISYPQMLLEEAAKLLNLCRSQGLRIAAAESCTGGLLSGLFTEIPGSSDVFERGFVTYSNASKAETLGVPEPMLEQFGAVSEPVALAMANGLLASTPANVGISITGIAGPDGGTADKPVGLVYLAAVAKGRPPAQSRLLLGQMTRNAIREASLAEALRLLRIQLER